MKAVLYSFFLLIQLVFSPSEPRKSAVVRRFVVLPSSRVSIHGKTNVNTFQCAISQYTGNDTLVLQENGSARNMVFLKRHVWLKTDCFDCGLAAMTRDFGKTIQSQKYPLIGIEFLSLEQTPYKDTYTGKVRITLAGVTRSFELPCSLEARQAGISSLDGSRDFTFSDFNLKAPTRLMGMVQVCDELNVHFHLMLRHEHTFVTAK